MIDSNPEALEKQLRDLFKDALPDQAVYDIHAAMTLAKVLEGRGFTFQLKDLYPKSMTETGWRAVFSKDGVSFSADDPQSAMAVCRAAADAAALELDT